MDHFLIINADDFGLTSGVNRGILETHTKGVVTSTSLMVNTPGFDEAVEFAQSTPSLGVGFHFNLTTGKPLTQNRTDIASLVDDSGHFRPLEPGISPKWHKVDVQRELEHQWQQIKKTKLMITHIDTHHYIQRFPQVYEPLSALARNQGIALRHTFVIHPILADDPPISGFHSNRSTLPFDHPKTTDYFIGDEYYEADGIERIKQHLQHLQWGVTELNCHPGYIDEPLKQLSSWLKEREKERVLFKRKKLREEIRSRNIRLINYRQINKN